MIKFETVGMYEVSKNDPTIVLDKDIMNDSFIVKDGVTYWMHNIVNGDDAYKNGLILKAGKKLRGFDLEANKNQKLIVEAKHIEGDFATVSAKDTILVVNEETGKLEVGEASGVYFVVEEKCDLTEQAVKVIIKVA